MGELIRQDCAAAPAESLQLLTFVVAGEMYALGILRIREIIEYGRVTTIPMMPAFIRGVINLRGRVVPIIDLAARFGAPPVQAARRTCIVIVETGEERFDVGLVVDAVCEVLELPAERIEPAPAFGARVRTDFIRGMGRIGEQFVVILDEQRVLSIEEMCELARLAIDGAAVG
ncbi:chemotaxis protein CheW [Plasticicumulans acidivorans]|uniref:Purine-binding chemotaxis protein CheW n=1 Tax=Plasticicumulans acidivorans TaxID=886464 RepID=A0A317MRA6_9GAMM|nr:chemotaxis protein CheW [Plasticicumulans acidivorans]PWV58747.1 purine-binding chemotaxis protein CheW [Plasticicumulans acidivorans]